MALIGPVVALSRPVARLLLGLQPSGPGWRGDSLRLAVALGLYPFPRLGLLYRLGVLGILRFPLYRNGLNIDDIPRGLGLGLRGAALLR